MRGGIVTGRRRSRITRLEMAGDADEIDDGEMQSDDAEF